MEIWLEGSKKIKWKKFNRDKMDLYETHENGFAYSICGAEDADGQIPQASPWLHCRDYFQDYMYAGLHAEKLSEELRKAYGITDKMPVSFDPFWVLVGDEDADPLEMRRMVRASKEFLNIFEKRMGLKRTKVYTVSNPKRGMGRKVYLYRASAVWARAAPLTSMFTLLARVGMVHSFGDHPATTMGLVISRKKNMVRGEDVTTLQEALPAIVKLASRGGRGRYFSTDPVANYPGEVSIDDFHHHFGIASFADGQTDSFLPGSRFPKERALTIEQRAEKALRTAREWR